MHGLFTLLFLLLMFVFAIDPTVALCLMAVMISLLSPSRFHLAHPSPFFFVSCFSHLSSLSPFFSHTSLSFYPKFSLTNKRTKGSSCRPAKKTALESWEKWKWTKGEKERKVNKEGPVLFQDVLVYSNSLVMPTLCLFDRSRSIQTILGGVFEGG